jgi:DNA-binding NarL/FixJ family response regulator
MNRANKLKMAVLLVDDHPVIRAGLRASLLTHGGFEVLGEAASGQEAITKAKELTPDIVIMDMGMPGINGLEATRRLRALCPQAKVLLLTLEESPVVARQTVECGAQGYVRKDTSAQELRLAIERLQRGETLSPGQAAHGFLVGCAVNDPKTERAGAKPLSERERQILSYVVDGLASKEIAHHLRLTVRTVEKHRQRIMGKLGIHKATELVKYAISCGLVNLEPNNPSCSLPGAA